VIRPRANQIGVTQSQQDVVASSSTQCDPGMLVQDATRSTSRQLHALQLPARLVTHLPSELQGPMPA
jgi:hypothetical protein